MGWMQMLTRNPLYTASPNYLIKSGTMEATGGYIRHKHLNRMKGSRLLMDIVGWSSVKSSWVNVSVIKMILIALHSHFSQKTLPAINIHFSLSLRSFPLGFYKSGSQNNNIIHVVVLSFLLYTYIPTYWTCWKSQKNGHLIYCKVWEYNIMWVNTLDALY